MDVATDGATEILERADSLYERRGELANVLECVRLLQSVEVKGFEDAWRLGRACFFVGQEAANRKKRLSYFTEGWIASASANIFDDERVEGHFWLGVNLALLAGELNFIKAPVFARMARTELLRAVAIDSGFHGAGPLRVLARLEAKLPRFLGGGRKRAREHFEEAIRISPENTVTRIYYAELLMKSGDRSYARRHLEAVLSAPDETFWQFEIDRDKRLAREMMDKTS